MKWLTWKLLAILVGIIITSPCLLAFIGFLVGGLAMRGSFEPWHPLGTPPEQAIKIYADYGETPFVETVNGDFYHCTHIKQLNPQSCWIKVNQSELKVVDSYPCWSNVHFNVPSPPGEVSDMIETQICESGLGAMWTTQHNFVLLKDGSVWAWNYSYAGAYSELGIIVYILTGLFWGAILGVVIAFIWFTFSVVRYKFLVRH